MPFRAKKEKLKTFQRLLPESQRQNLASTVLYVPYSLDGRALRVHGLSPSCRPGLVAKIRQLWRQTAVELGGNNLNGFKDFRTEKGPSEGQNLTLSVLFVPNSLDSGGRENLGAGQQHLHAGLLCAIFAQKRNGPSTSGRPRRVVQIRQLWKQKGREALEAAPPRKP